MTEIDRPDLPKTVKIIDSVYKIRCFTSPSEVDVVNRNVMWGCIDHWLNEIRLYAPTHFSAGEIWNTLWHEILHAITDTLKINEIKNMDEIDEEHALHLLATGLNAVLQDMNIEIYKTEKKA